jgi:hypothetical protein
LRVCHDNEGDWQFLCDGFHSESMPLIVCLGCAVERDPSLVEVATLPAGWVAERKAQGEAWSREKNPDEEGGGSEA